MKLGLENKKETALLGVLILVAVIMIYRNVLSGPSAAPERPAAASARSAAIAEAVAPSISQADTPVAPRRARSASEEFHPVLRSKRPEDRIDPMKVDPTLHLEVLARLQSAGSDTNGRNVFQFGAPPPPPPPKDASRLKMPEPVVVPQPPPVTVSAPPGPPPPPPIPFKFYGMSRVVSTGKKDAFFKQSDNIFIAAEGEMLMNRYRVKSIGVNSVVIEDTQLKREQPLPLAGDADGPGY